jgi:acetyl esterase/lipase
MQLPLLVTSTLLAATLCASLAHGAEEPIPLWPNTPPGEKGGLPEEKDLTKDTDNQVGGRRLMRIGNISTPTITVYKAPADKNTGTAVLICPGGGYSILAWDLEGTEVCEWLNSIGVTGIVLKYRVPKRPDLDRFAPPLQDAQRAMGLIRSRASEWGINPAKIGVLGFSAGGHLSANLSTNYAQRTYPKVDAADEQSARPDFSVLIYPAYLTQKDKPLDLSPELKVDEKTPPAFLVHAQDDGIAAENSIGYFVALKNAKVPGELHVFPKGGHGYGLRPTDVAVTHWPKLAEQWMRGLGLLGTK